MNPRIALIAVLCLLPVASAYAQSVGSEIDYLPGPRHLEALADPASQVSPSLKVNVLSDRGHYRYLVVARTETGEAEVHAGWADVTAIREGSGTLVYGGRIEGGRETEPGEVRGGRIVDGNRRAVVAGDVVILPPGIPHQVELRPGETITYTVVKVEYPNEAE